MQMFAVDFTHTLHCVLLLDIMLSELLLFLC